MEKKKYPGRHPGHYFGNCTYDITSGWSLAVGLISGVVLPGVSGAWLRFTGLGEKEV